MTGFKPDWSAIWTAKEAEKQLSNDTTSFEFRGPGWYFADESYGADGRVANGDVVLVLPATDEPGERMWMSASHWPANQKFEFHVYNGRNPAQAFCAIANAPTRQDDRD